MECEWSKLSIKYINNNTLITRYFCLCESAYKTENYNDIEYNPQTRSYKFIVADKFQDRNLIIYIINLQNLQNHLLFLILCYKRYIMELKNKLPRYNVVPTTTVAGFFKTIIHDPTIENTINSRPLQLFI